ncbi:Origin recognition complex, subunit 1, partial [Coemansia sp. RSA 2703]
MSTNIQRSKVASRLEKAAKQAKQPRTKRKQHLSYDSDSDTEAVVEWGERVDGGNKSVSALRAARRVTRHSGMTNKEMYRSVIVNGIEYRLGQTVQVESSSDEPHLATIHRLWENERGEKQMVARWLLRRNEMFLNKKAKEIVSEPNEVFYSNADDLITPDMILAPLDVLSRTEFEKKSRESAKLSAKTKLWFCSRHFNEHTAAVGDLDWDEFYHGGKILDPAVDVEMFAKTEKKMLGKEAATKAGRMKVASKRNAASVAATKTSASKRRRKHLSDNEDEDEDEDEEDRDIDDDEDEDFVEPEAEKPLKTPAKRSAAVRSRRATLATVSVSRAATPSTVTKRRKRLADIQPAAVSAAILKRAARGRTSANASESNQTIYETARQRLHVSATPDTLPCREDEFAEIYGSLYTALEERNSMCMYISGVPGTGKTATVHEVIRTLKENTDEGELPEFEYIELNGMKMTEPSQAYTQLWQAISGEKATPKHAAQLLEKHFSTPSPRRHSYVVLMDELDLLVTKSQSIMYNFFDWPHRPHAKLVVVAIANTMDLPERMLHHKVSSRLGLTRINFQPYTHQQLMTIVQSRLEGCEAFDDDAVELCARKISAVSGDARRALDVCRRAVEIVEAEWTRRSTASNKQSASDP